VVWVAVRRPPHAVLCLGATIVSGLIKTTAILTLSLLDQTPKEPLPPELSALHDSLQRTKRVSARFTQTRHLSALHGALTSEGSLEYENGGRLVWKTLPPAESELVLDGQHVTISYPGMGGAQTVDFSADPGMGRVFETIRAVLQADLVELQPLFKLVVVRKQPLSLALSPKTEVLARTLRRIELDFDRRLRLVHVGLTEPDGDSTDIVFRDHVLQSSVP
jgi:outer membrane lipoprotein-sorting protein